LSGKVIALLYKNTGMKAVKFIFLSIFILAATSCDTLNQASQILVQSGMNPTQTEIVSGLKQALEVGTNSGSDQLSIKDGYFGNLAIKILFPEEAQKVEKTLRSLGLNSLADNVILSVNRAAEDAAKEAKPIFVAAIQKMTIADATNILLSGNKDAATQYFKRVTSEELRTKFQPVIQNSLSKVGATRYWSSAVTSYNKIPLVTHVNPDLEGYVTQKAIDGLFVEIAQEELKIRQSTAARSTALLQKVFGYADKH
jgi:ribosomal protein L30/L7E